MGGEKQERSFFILLYFDSLFLDAAVLPYYTDTIWTQGRDWVFRGSFDLIRKIFWYGHPSAATVQTQHSCAKVKQTMIKYGNILFIYEKRESFMLCKFHPERDSFMILTTSLKSTVEMCDLLNMNLGIGRYLFLCVQATQKCRKQVKSGNK